MGRGTRRRTEQEEHHLPRRRFSNEREEELKKTKDQQPPTATTTNTEKDEGWAEEEQTPTPTVTERGRSKWWEKEEEATVGRRDEGFELYWQKYRSIYIIRMNDIFAISPQVLDAPTKMLGAPSNTLSTLVLYPSPFWSLFFEKKKKNFFFI